MADPYRILGSELSPYSVKVRSYCRYKRIPHEWQLRGAHPEDFQKYARLPLVPLVITPDEQGIQDSTPIIEKLEEIFPEPSIHPDDPASAFLSALIEEYGDEWGNKWMFHYRWTYEADQKSAAERIVLDMMPGVSDAQVQQASAGIRERMVPRLSFVGSSDATRDQIERSFQRGLAILEPHLALRPYLFGARPAFADFGLYTQLHQCSTDPTAGAMIRERSPEVTAWLERMLDPSADGPFEAWEELAPTLEPLLRDEVGGVFLPWSAANARAIGAGEKELEVELEGKPFRQQTQKYHAKSLGVLRARYAAVSDRSALDPVLEKTGCLAWLR